MKLVGFIRHFNTGRHYGPAAQPISWVVVERDPEDSKACGICRRWRTPQCVVFIDHARFIAGSIDLHFGNLDLLDDAWVLRAYDDHHYQILGREVDFFRSQLDKEM